MHTTLSITGGMLGENNPWSSSSSSSGMWSNMNPTGQYLDNQNESHTGTSNGPHSIPANSSQSFDIPEFVPGVPWPGANSNKVEDDPNITPGSVARSLSVSTASGHNGSGRLLVSSVAFYYYLIGSCDTRAHLSQNSFIYCGVKNIVFCFKTLAYAIKTCLVG